MPEISPSEGEPKPIQLPPTKGEIAKRYFWEIKLSRANPYVLDVVEFSIEHANELLKSQGKTLDPSQGLISFACSDALLERMIAEYYLKGHIKRARNDPAGERGIPHYDNLHFYDIRINDGRWHFFSVIGKPHEIDIFKALAQSSRPDSDTPKAPLFFMKGIEFFYTVEAYDAHGNFIGKHQSEEQKKRLKLFRQNIKNFLTNTALLFITKNSPALLHMEKQGFTRIHIEDRAVEDASNLEVYLYQRPTTEPPPPPVLRAKTRTTILPED